MKSPSLNNEEATFVVQCVIDSGGFEPTDDRFYTLDIAAIEQGYIVRQPGDRYAVTPQGRRLLK